MDRQLALFSLMVSTSLKNIGYQPTIPNLGERHLKPPTSFLLHAVCTSEVPVWGPTNNLRRSIIAVPGLPWLEATVDLLVPWILEIHGNQPGHHAQPPRFFPSFQRLGPPATTALSLCRRPLGWSQVTAFPSFPQHRWCPCLLTVPGGTSRCPATHGSRRSAVRNDPASPRRPERQPSLGKNR